MNREKLTSAIQTIATAEGYKFYSGEERHVPQFVEGYPALWLTPPEFSSMEGRKHGSVIYSVKLHALCEGAKLSAAERSTTRCVQEEALVKLFTTLSNEMFVAEVENLKIRHSTQTLSSHGEVVTTATADVITLF